MSVMNLPPALMQALAAKTGGGMAGPMAGAMGGPPPGGPAGLGNGAPVQPSVLKPHLTVAKPHIKSRPKISPLVAKALKAKAKRAGMGR